ncbi:hypothetical protein DRO69_09880 [Candidatus Bathyarchaeota archaeon]|nr:MAG: hypothetical protein DRO69_09880 [Candidatus Bathyarchaeota archaeon]
MFILRKEKVGGSLEIPKPNIIVGGNNDYYGMYVPAMKTIFLTSLTNEFNVEWILNHETIHHVLEHRLNHDVSVKFDNIDFELWTLLHQDSDEVLNKPIEDENILKKIWKITKVSLTKLPSVLFFKRF